MRDQSNQFRNRLNWSKKKCQKSRRRRACTSLNSFCFWCNGTRVNVSKSLLWVSGRGRKKEINTLIFHSRGACVFSPRTNGCLTSTVVRSLTVVCSAAFMHTLFHARAFIGTITFIVGEKAGGLSDFYGTDSDRCHARAAFSHLTVKYLHLKKPLLSHFLFF